MTCNSASVPESSISKDPKSRHFNYTVDDTGIGSGCLGRGLREGERWTEESG